MRKYLLIDIYAQKNVVSVPVPAIHCPHIPSLYPSIISTTVADLTKSSNCPHSNSSECHIRIPSVDNELQKLQKLPKLPNCPHYRNSSKPAPLHQDTKKPEDFHLPVSSAEREGFDTQLQPPPDTPPTHYCRALFHR